MPRAILTGAMLIGALALSAPALDAQNAVTVDMQEFSFQPHEWTLTPGPAVRWVNHDDSPHHVVTETKLVDAGVIGPGTTFEFTFTQPGRFAYRCAYCVLNTTPPAGRTLGVLAVGETVRRAHMPA